MKTRLTFLIIILMIESLQAQFSQQWVNHVCCFDPVQPHTFSYPLFKEVRQDTIMLGFFEDYLFKFNLINKSFGNTFTTMTANADTIQSPFYYGGGTTKIANKNITSSMKYDMGNGQYKLYHSSTNLGLFWSNSIPTYGGKISKPLGNINETEFYTCEVADSVRIYKYLMSGFPFSNSAFPVGNPANIQTPHLFLSTGGNVTALVYESDSVNFKSTIRLIQLNGMNNLLVLDTNYLSSRGTSHIVKQINDILKIAFIDSMQTISFMEIDLLSFNVTKYYNTNIICWTPLTKYSIDTMTDNYYLKTGDHLLAYTAQDSLLFNISIPTEAQAQYDHGEIVFDSLDLFMAYSFHSILNVPPNDDIKLFRINKSNGTIEASTEYNDIRNTGDNFLDNFLDGNNFYVIFANNFDNASILQEETQLGVIKYASLTSEVNNDHCCNSSIKLFPNPFHSTVTIKMDPPEENVDYCIYNLTGGIAANGFTSNNSNINLEKLSNGVYTMVLKFRNGSSSFHKIIKL